jgi:hypothetical protein
MDRTEHCEFVGLVSEVVLGEEEEDDREWVAALEVRWGKCGRRGNKTHRWRDRELKKED